MRFAAALVVLAALTAVAPAAPSPETLEVYAIATTAKTSTFRGAFPVPLDAPSRDLRDEIVTLRIGDETPVAFGSVSSRVKFNKAGTRFTYAAPKKSAARVLKLRVSVAAGAVVATLGGAKLDKRRPPVVELATGAHLYRFVPPAAPGVPPEPPPEPLPTVLPDGPIAFTTVYRAANQLAGTTTQNMAIRDGIVLSMFTGSVVFPSGVPSALTQTDFSSQMLLVAAGDVVGLGAIPFSVRIQSVEIKSGRLVVNYDRYWYFSNLAPPGIPVWSAHFHAVRVPQSSAAVEFVATPVKTQLPHQ